MTELHEGFDPIYSGSSKGHINERSLSEVLSEKEIGKITPIIKHIQQFGMITPIKAQEVTDKAPATVRRYLKLLCEKDILISEGSTNSIMYSFKK